MLVSLNKNKWLYTWMREHWQEDLYKILSANDPYVKRPSTIKREVAKLLNSKGYKAKLTNGDDIIVTMKEEDYIFLKLRYQ